MRLIGALRGGMIGAVGGSIIQALESSPRKGPHARAREAAAAGGKTKRKGSATSGGR